MCDVVETRHCVETTVFVDANHRQMCSLIINRQLMHILVGLCVCPGSSGVVSVLWCVCGWGLVLAHRDALQGAERPSGPGGDGHIDTGAVLSGGTCFVERLSTKTSYLRITES